MKRQILFSGKYKKNITNLSSAELAQRVVKIKEHQMSAVLCCAIIYSRISIELFYAIYLPIR